MMRSVKKLFSLLVALALAPPLAAETVPVRYPEGIVHGFLTLSTLDGKRVASGDSIQVARGDRVTTTIVFHFPDGSLHEETTVFTQRGRFRLVSYKLVQKGPAFPRPLDMSLDAASGRCVVRATDKDGKEQRYDERLKLTPDVANGLVTTLLKNVAGNPARVELPMVLATPKPRLVKLQIAPAGEDAFRVGAVDHKAVRYQIHIDLGGVVEILADLAGKAPPDTRLWMERGEAPGFVRSEGPMAIGTPKWRIDLASPEFGGK
jgi:hypothetical protein